MRRFLLPLISLGIYSLLGCRPSAHAQHLKDDPRPPAAKPTPEQASRLTAKPLEGPFAQLKDWCAAITKLNHGRKSILAMITGMVNRNIERPPTICAGASESARMPVIRSRNTTAATDPDQTRLTT